MECRSRPPEIPQYYNDPATGKETDCWSICGGTKVPVLCDKYCQGYCETEHNAVSAPTSSTTSTPGKPELNSAVIVLIVVVVLLFVVLLLLLVIYLWKRFIREKGWNLLRFNHPQQRNPEDGVSNGKNDSTREGGKKAAENGLSPKPNASVNAKQSSDVMKKGNGVSKQPNYSVDKKSKAVVYSKSSQPTNPALANSDTQTDSVSQHTSGNVCKQSVSTDTGIGSMPHAYRDAGNMTPHTESEAGEVPGGSDNSQQIVQFTRSESGKTVGHPSHSYTEKNKLVTSPSDDGEHTSVFFSQEHSGVMSPGTNSGSHIAVATELTPMLPLQENSSAVSPVSNSGSNTATVAPDFQGMDEDVAEEYLQSLQNSQ